MLLHYANGVVGMLSHSDCLFEGQNHFHIHGDQGLISWTPDRMVIQKAGQPERIIDWPAEVAYTNMWQAMARAWHTDSQPYYTAERALRDVRIVESVYESIKRGQPVTLT